MENKELTLREKIKETADFLRSNGVIEPEVLVILGSGLNDYADRIENSMVIPYADIPNFRTGKAAGHRGQLIYGTHMGKKVVLLAGRFHYYESHDMDVTAFPARVMVELGVKRFVITNACGCVNTDFHAGQLMLMSDHINYSGANPLIGDNLDEYGPRFPDMTYTYSKELREKVKAKAEEAGIELAEGVYMMFSGPTFETPAEVRLARIVGADAVGMSSVPEAIIASHAKREVIGISFLTNMAAGVLDQPLSGEEVTEASKLGAEMFSKVADFAIEV
ncbi:MAG: purine-nucleoside phosphorylase [Bacillota bacterium]|nr:purine-nucleoside phosphorylase [Bacillota bacterium]